MGLIAQSETTAQEQWVLEYYSDYLKTDGDWANLARYRDYNELVRSKTLASNRVVFVGNSITEGWVNISPAFFSENNFVGRGISGQTTPQMLLRFQEDVIKLKPAAVVILAGTNDLAENTGPSSNEMIQDNLAAMAELAKSHGIEVILSSILPVYDYPWSPGLNPAERIVAINSWMKNYCVENRFVYLDYFSATADERNGFMERYTTDGVHCSKEGYNLMENLALPAIEKALKKDN